MQRILDDLLGRQLEPLADGNVGEFGRFQNLEEDDILGSGVFNVMGKSRRYVADVAGLEVECAACGRG